MDQILLKKVIFSEDDRTEYPVIAFKSREGAFDLQPYFSVINGDEEIASLPLNL